MSDPRDAGPAQGSDPAQADAAAERTTVLPSDAFPGSELDQLRAELADAQARAAENWSSYLRASAEIDNVRKRSAREVEAARQYGAERLAGDVLPVLDSLLLATQVTAADPATLVEGQQATLRLLQKALERAGIVELDPVGQPFNPELHEAMAMQPAPDSPANTVLTVVQKGYQLNGRLLRPARVIVAAAG